MNVPYIIVYEPFKDSSDETSFHEIITSNFISKKVRNNTYMIVNDKDMKPKDIYNMIDSKFNPNSDFFVSKLDKFYGTFFKDGIEWMMEKFPGHDWLD